jgi:hypothetical protein
MTLLLLLFLSCSGDSDSDPGTNPPPQNEIIPSNLILTIEIVGADENNPNGNGSGIINCIATATNAVRYGFKFGILAEKESVSGNISHTFADIGTNDYQVTVIAYSSTNNAISSVKTVTVFVDPGAEGLVWSDEFDVDGAVNSEKWHHQVQIPDGGNWFNGEVQHYTNRLENSYVDNGTLKIVAKKEIFSDQGYTKDYTSARLNSKFAFTYGTVHIRAKLPGRLLGCRFWCGRLASLRRDRYYGTNGLG